MEGSACGYSCFKAGGKFKPAIAPMAMMLSQSFLTNEEESGEAYMIKDEVLKEEYEVMSTR